MYLNVPLSLFGLVLFGQSDGKYPVIKFRVDLVVHDIIDIDTPLELPVSSLPAYITLVLYFLSLIPFG